MHIVKQHDERDCGAACLSMIAAYHGLKMPISKFRELTKTDKLGTNLYGISDGAYKIGLTPDVLSGTPSELLEGIEKKEFSFPLIAHVITDDVMLHFVVIFSYKDGYFIIGDPAQGKQKISTTEFFSAWTGYIVTFEKGPCFTPGNLSKGSFIKFFSLLKGQYTKLAGILLLSLFIAIVGILGAFVFQIAIDEFTTRQHLFEEDELKSEIEDDDEDTAEESGIAHELSHKLTHVLDQIKGLSGNNINLIFTAVLLLYILRGLIQYFRGWIIVKLSRKIDIKLTLSYYNHVLGLPVSSIITRQTGEYLSRFSDSSTIRQAISGATITLIMDSIMAVVGAILLFAENQRLFAVSLVMVFLYAVIFLVYRKPIEYSNRQVMEDSARLQSYFKETIDGIEEIKASGAEDQIEKNTEHKYHTFLDSVVKNSMISISQDSLVDTIELAGNVVILWIGFTMILHNATTIGALMAFYVLLDYFFGPIKNLIELQPTIQTAFVAADRLNDILDLQPEFQNEEGLSVSKINELELKNVDFRYGNRELTLNNINLSVHHGKKVAIVGESGSGKTTIAKLLLRFYSPESGKVLLNGKDINDFCLTSIRDSIAYVHQNTFLFSDTIKSNLTLGNPNISDDEIKRACKICCLDDFISSLPFGYDTPLSENGSNISGGQRQRIAIAKAILKKPQVLILDEATSNLDAITENAIKDTIFNIDDKLTCIIIAHRLTTIKKCDTIYVMDNGEIVESGTHDELLSINGKYASLWKSQ